MKVFLQLCRSLYGAGKPLLMLLCVLGGLALGAGGVLLARRPATSAPTVKGADSEHAGHEGHDEREGGAIHLPREKWKSAKIRIAPVQEGSFTETSIVTGKLALNEDRLAHIYSLVDGVVHEVRVGFGDEVRAGDELAVIDSTVVGQAKLSLVKDQLSADFAKVNYEWNQTIYKNTQALIEALEKGTTIPEIEQRFHDQPMGEYRQQLISSYARYHQTQADFTRLKDLSERGIKSEKDSIKAKADFVAAQATFRAWVEEIKFTSWQQMLDSEQQLRKAEMAYGTSRSSLYVMGYHEDEVSRMKPLDEGEGVAHYTIKSPFDGTVIGKNVVLDERVGPNTELFQVADLSSVWLQADIFEKDLQLLAGLEGKQIQFWVAGYPDRLFYAQVFYTGDIVDESTRTVRLMGVTENPDRLLKPGTFVEMKLPVRSYANVLQVPASAVQEHEGETFVFVHQGGDEFERRDVTPGRRSDGKIEIIDGLKPGEPIVVEGTFAVKSEMLSESMRESGHSH